MNAVAVTPEPDEPRRSMTPTPGDLLRIAVEQGADLDKLSRLMDLQERWEAGEARKAWVQAMTEFKADPPEILKRKQVRFESQKGVTEYMHAELSDVTAAVCGALAQHGLSHRWRVEQGDGGVISVTCIMTHRRGHSEEVKLSSLPDQSGGKNAIQSVASTVTYLERYTLLAACGLATQSMTDDDGRGSDPKAETDEERDAREKAAAKLATWIDAINACADVTELKARKVELVKAYGDVVPEAATSAYNAKFRALSPKK